MLAVQEDAVIISPLPFAKAVPPYTQKETSEPISLQVSLIHLMLNRDPKVY